VKQASGRLALLGVALFAWMGTSAAADPIETTFTVTANFLNGKHQTSDFPADQLHFVPLPLSELTLRRGHDAIRIEGLPPVSFHYGSSAGDGAQSTQLSILNGTYRRTIGAGWFVGVGQTLYNQSTTYTNAPGFVYQRGDQVYPIIASEKQYSRVAGTRFEAGRIMEVGRRRDRLEISAALNPKLHGNQYTSIPTYAPINACPIGPGSSPVCTIPTQTLTFSDPETATQVDISARIVHKVGRGELIYGIRYLNYVAHYVDVPGMLADRNVGIAPLLGYRFRL
jgi:hypothetical protein